ncbi:MAG: transcription termination/antitermination protein NusG [bacterium]|nr:transcription termination/antitermination protein NusG [bacterium]
MAETAYEANGFNLQGAEETTEAKWYVVHTYSGYENKVMDNIKRYVENHNMYELIPDVMIPMREVVEAGGSADGLSDNDGGSEDFGTSKKAKEPKKVKLFPGYVFIKMVMNAETWYVVRNTRGVTGFVGPASKPSPLSNEDLERMGLVTELVEEVPFSVGDEVNIIAGQMEGFSGKVISIDTKRHKVQVSVYMFNRSTPAELDISQVKAAEF